MQQLSKCWRVPISQANVLLVCGLLLVSRLQQRAHQSTHFLTTYQNMVSISFYLFVLCKWQQTVFYSEINPTLIHFWHISKDQFSISFEEKQSTNVLRWRILIWVLEIMRRCIEFDYCGKREDALWWDWGHNLFSWHQKYHIFWVPKEHNIFSRHQK